MKKAALHNLGCKVNAYETEAMQQMLEAAGYEIVPFEPGADIYVINTCTVTNIADRKSRQMLHKAKKMNPDAIVVAAGCYVQADTKKAEADASIDIIIGNNKKQELISILENYRSGQQKTTECVDINHTKEYEKLEIDRTEEHTRAYLKVQDGCNQFCTYCMIPYARGRIRSKKTEDVVGEVKRLAASGCQEVVLTGIHLSSYGKELMKDVDDILNAYLRLEERAAGLRTEEKTVRIGTVYPLAAGMVPRMLQKFGATFPFVVYNRLTPEIAEGLMDGKYDIGFCSDLLKSEELEYYPIRESYIAVVVPKGHHFEKRESISLKEVALYPQIMFSKTSGFRNLQEQIFDKEGIKVRPVCTAEELEVITGLVENGVGISVLPYMDIIRHHNIVAIPVQTSIWKSKFYIARRKYGIRSDQEEAFFQYWRKNRL